MSVVEFRPRETPRKPDEQWASDTAICIGCRHEWNAVAQLGTRWLECPGCGAMKGIFKKPFGADEGDSVYRCNICESEAMTAFYRDGLFYFQCMNCGVDHTDAIFGGS